MHNRDVTTDKKLIDVNTAMVLVVEDTEVSRKIAIAILKKLGFKNFTVAEDIKTAIEKLETSKYDLVYEDFNLPYNKKDLKDKPEDPEIKDGSNIIELIRRKEKSTNTTDQTDHKCIIWGCSANKEGGKGKLIKAGANFVSSDKPFNMYELRDYLAPHFNVISEQDLIDSNKNRSNMSLSNPATTTRSITMSTSAVASTVATSAVSDSNDTSTTPVIGSGTESSKSKNPSPTKDKTSPTKETTSSPRGKRSQSLDSPPSSPTKKHHSGVPQNASSQEQVADAQRDIISSKSATSENKGSSQTNKPFPQYATFTAQKRDVGERNSPVSSASISPNFTPENTPLLDKKLDSKSARKRLLFTISNKEPMQPNPNQTNPNQKVTTEEPKSSQKVTTEQPKPSQQTSEEPKPPTPPASEEPKPSQQAASEGAKPRSVWCSPLTLVGALAVGVVAVGAGIYMSLNGPNNK